MCRAVFCGQVAGPGISTVKYTSILWGHFSQVSNTWNCLLFLPLAVPGPFGDSGINADLFWSLWDGLLWKHSVLTISASSVPILSSFWSGDSIGLFNQWAEFRELKSGARTKSYFIQGDTWVAGKEKELVHALPTLNIPPLPLWSQLTTLPLVHSVAATYADLDIIPGTFLIRALYLLVHPKWNSLPQS